MVLSQLDLRKAVHDGDIVFTPPLEEKQWGEASVDLRLGFSFTKFKDIKGVTVSVSDGLSAVAALNLWSVQQLEPKDKLGRPERFTLHPGEFVLALTYESIRIGNGLIGLIEGRSTYARVGLSMHQTAPWIQPGWSGPIILEMMNHGPLAIDLTPMIDRPCQLSFLRLTSPVPENIAYGARASDVYKDQTGPFPSGEKSKN